MKLAEHIFNTPDNQYPLQYQSKILNTDDNRRQDNKQWVTATDIDYLTLVMIYALLRTAWEKNVLILGLVKDIAAADMIKTVLPILQYSGSLTFRRELPRFNSDKMLLQTASIINPEFASAPWRTFEYDTCLKTVAPLKEDDSDQAGSSSNPRESEENKKEILRRRAKVAGAFKNLISGEKMFLKSYIQLWGSKTDPTVRSHVFCYDRPASTCYESAYRCYNHFFTCFHLLRVRLPLLQSFLYLLLAATSVT